MDASNNEWRCEASEQMGTGVCAPPLRYTHAVPLHTTRSVPSVAQAILCIMGITAQPSL